MSARRISAVLKKQWKDTLKNKTVLIQFLMFPLITIIMQHSVRIDDMPPHFFVTLFGVMYIGMAPLTSMAAIIAEEKEKNTLRVLLMSNVRAGEYLTGVGVYVFCLCLIGSLIIGLQDSYRPAALLRFVLVMAAGILISALIGAAVGVVSRNQMAATSISVPLMFVLSFFPMLAYFNDAIGKVSKFVYSQQIYNWLVEIEDFHPGWKSVLTVIVNAAIALFLFVLFIRKKGLEAQI